MVSKIRRELKDLAARGQMKSFTRTHAAPGGEILYKGKKVIDLTSWDYLSLACHKSIKTALHAAIEHDETFPTSPRLASGTRRAHLSVEERLSKFLGTESTLFFSSRNQAVFSLLTSILNETDSVCIEESTTAPVADAAYLVGAATFHFSFSAIEWKRQLEEYLQKQKGRAIYLYLDTLSPITGARCRMHEVAPLCVQYGVKLVVDDSYALGAVGLRGAGFLDCFPQYKQSLFAIVGSFGLGIPGYGAFIAGSQELTAYLINRSKTFFQEPPLPEFLCAAMEVMIDQCELSSHIRENMEKSAKQFSKHLVSCGYHLAQEPDASIVSIACSKPSVADELCAYLLAKGFLIERVLSGSPLNQRCLVRFVFTSALKEEQVERLHSVLVAVGC